MKGCGCGGSGLDCRGCFFFPSPTPLRGAVPVPEPIFPLAPPPLASSPATLRRLLPTHTAEAGTGTKEEEEEEDDDDDGRTGPGAAARPPPRAAAVDEERFPADEELDVVAVKVMAADGLVLAVTTPCLLLPAAVKADPRADEAADLVALVIDAINARVAREGTAGPMLAGRKAGVMVKRGCWAGGGGGGGGDGNGPGETASIPVE